MYGTTRRDTFLGYRILGAGSYRAVWLWLASSAGYRGALTVLGVSLCALAAGWVAADDHHAEARPAPARADRLALPELIDLLVVTVEAGLGFSGVAAGRGRALHGPLGDELR